MNDPQYARPGDIIPKLALDAALPLYGQLHVPPDDGSLRMHAFLKQALEYANLAERADLWDRVVAYGQATLDANDQSQWLSWIFNAFTGSHAPDIDLSSWLMAMDYFHVVPNAWQNAGMGANDVALAKAFIDRYFIELDEPGFIAAMDDCRAQPMTAWDKRIHAAYGFVYFDRASGADPSGLTLRAPFTMSSLVVFRSGTSKMSRRLKSSAPSCGTSTAGLSATAKCTGIGVSDAPITTGTPWLWISRPICWVR